MSKNKTNIILKVLLLCTIFTSTLFSETITHNGFTYETVTSPYTGRVWLDRNLGASRVCQSYDDEQCYGDYYQWGRNTDGHEKKDSNITDIQAADVTNVGHGMIIVSGDEYKNDWAYFIDLNGSLRNNNWLKTDGSSICPLGFNVPNINELKEETILEGTSNKIDAFNNFLKIPSSGFRYSTSYSPSYMGTNGGFGSVTIDNYNQKIMAFNSDVFNESSVNRTFGINIRCIKPNTLQNQLPQAIVNSTNITTYQGSAVILDASNSTDSDGNITSYLWSEGDVTLSNDISFTKYDFDLGVHTITLKVTDDKNATNETNITVTINEYPKINLIGTGTITNSLTFLENKKVYEFTLNEKSRVTIDTSNSNTNVAAWVIDSNNTKISELINWEASSNSQFYYDAILEAGTYIIEFFPKNFGAIGDFSFVFDTEAYDTIVQDPWIINIPNSIKYMNNDFVIIDLDIRAKTGIDISKLQVTSNDLPKDWYLKNPTGYGYKLYGTINTTENFSVTLNITDGNSSKEHTINFIINPFDIAFVTGEGSGARLAIKKDENNISKPFKSTFLLNGIKKENIQDIICQFKNNPILSIKAKLYIEAVEQATSLRYYCGVDVNSTINGAIDSADFMNKLEDIPNNERYMNILINLKDGTKYEHKVLDPIIVETIGKYIKIKNLNSSLEQNENNISIGILPSSNIYTETKDINNKTFFVEYGSEVLLNYGKWSLEVDSHELLIDIDAKTNGGLAFFVTEDMFEINNDLNGIRGNLLLNLSYANSIDTYINVYTKKIKSESEYLLKVATKVGSVWTKAIHLDEGTEFEIYTSPSVAGVRGTTFKMTLTNHGIDYDLYEGAIDINNSGVVTELKTMQSFKSDKNITKDIVSVVLPTDIKTYFDKTSLYQTDINTTVSKLKIDTNIDNASYILIGDNIRFGSGDINSFDNIAEGNYTLRFLNSKWYKKPADINITFNKDNLFETITSQYQKMVTIDINGTNISDDVDLNISNANIKVTQLEDESIYAVTKISDLNSSLNFSTLNSTINIDENGTTIATLPLSKTVKITIDKNGLIKPTIDNVLLPKDDFPLGTKVEVINNKVKFIVPMDEDLEF